MAEWKVDQKERLLTDIPRSSNWLGCKTLTLDMGVQILPGEIKNEQIVALLKYCKRTPSLYWKASAIRLILYIRKQNEESKMVEQKGPTD